MAALDDDAIALEGLSFILIKNKIVNHGIIYLP